MAIQPINNVLEQIHFQAQKISASVSEKPLQNKENSAEAMSFSSLLFNSINGLSQMQTTAKSQAESFMTGSSDIGLNDVMVSLQKSSLALNMGIQVRNKMVSAYQEIMNMQI